MGTDITYGMDYINAYFIGSQFDPFYTLLDTASQAKCMFFSSSSNIWHKM